MNSVMVFGALALAAVFAASFLWTSHMARDSKEEAEGLQDRIATEQEHKKQLENALAHAKLEYARQGGQMTALQDSIRQHNAMNQALRTALAEADTLREELRHRLMSEIAQSRQLGDRLAGALVAMNDVSQTISDMAERHRNAVQNLLEPLPAAPLPAAQPETLPPPAQDRPLALAPQTLETHAALA
jgi:septal ring factor EnvC (AmiA/AmiB activator)